MSPARRVEAMPRARQPGFTMLELLVAISIVGLLLAVAVPASSRFYESVRYRQAIGAVLTTLASARHAAISRGQAQDVAINPATNTIALAARSTRLPAGLVITVQSAGELNRGDAGVIRFYPEGGSSGGDIDLERPGGSGARISVDWLLGRVTQAAYVVN